MEVRERGVVFNGRTSVACTRQRRRGQLEMKWRAYNVEALGLQTRKMVQMGIEVVVDLGRGYTNVRIGKELHVTFEVRPNFPLWDPTNPHKPYLNLSASQFRTFGRCRQNSLQTCRPNCPHAGRGQTAAEGSAMIVRNPPFSRASATCL